MQKYINVNQDQQFCSQDGDGVILYMEDWIDFAAMDDIVKRYGTPTAIVGDVEGTLLNLVAPFYFVPALHMGMLNWVKYGLKDIKNFSEFQTLNCFCWSMNRPTIDRYITIKVLEWFGTSGPYTWSGTKRSEDCSVLFEEFRSINLSWFTEDFKSNLLAPITHKPRFVPESDVTAIEISGRCQHGDVISQWNHVQQDLSSTVAVYLLTESSTNQGKTYTFTEKTGWALMAANFPIWAGNYGQAYAASTMGIDIFDDVVNHDYQWKDTLIERCYHAVHDNLDILTNLDLARQLRQQHWSRLLDNRRWYLDGGLENYVNEQKQRLLAMNIDVSKFPGRF